MKVKIVNPMNETEKTWTYTVLELRENRVLVTCDYFIDWAIKPQEVFPLCDVEIVA